MSSKTREIFRVFDEASNSLSRKGSEIDTTKINHLLANLYSPGPSFQYVFDFSNRDFTYISPNINQILGVNFNSFHVNNFIALIHPDDFNHFIHCQEIGSYFMFTYIHKEELPHYKLSFQIRLKTSEGDYKLFLHQAMASTWENDYKMSSSFTNHSDISHITNINNNKVSFINIAGGKSYYGISKIEDLENDKLNKSLISNKELEILHLIAEGFRSKEIADYLNISHNTVTTHRRNILQKTNFSTIPQAITHFVREGKL